MKLLVCSDGTAAAGEAVAFGALLAEATSAETTLLGIASGPGEKEALRRALKRDEEEVRARGLEAETIVRSGEPIEEIRAEASAGYDLVVVGAGGRDRTGPFPFSTRTYRIAKAVEPPVVVVPEAARRARLDRILACAGGNPEFADTLPVVAEIARAAGADVTLVHVLPRPPAMFGELARAEDPEWIRRSSSRRARSLASAADLLEEGGVPLEVRLPRGLVVQEILQELREGTYDLVAAGSVPSDDRIRGWLLGDVTRELINRANRPVLVLRTAAAPRGIVERLVGVSKRLGRTLRDLRDRRLSSRRGP